MISTQRAVRWSEKLVWQATVHLSNESKILVWQAVVNPSNIGVAAAIPAILVPQVKYPKIKITQKRLVKKFSF